MYLYIEWKTIPKYASEELVSLSSELPYWKVWIYDGVLYIHLQWNSSARLWQRKLQYQIDTFSWYLQKCVNLMWNSCTLFNECYLFGWTLRKIYFKEEWRYDYQVYIFKALNIKIFHELFICLTHVLTKLLKNLPLYYLTKRIDPK